MTVGADDLLAGFEAAAKAAKEAEAAARKQVVEEIARIERERAFAFRRLRLIRTLLAGAANANTAEEAIAAQRQGIREELGWMGESAAQNEILVRLQPVGRQVWRCSCDADGATSAEVNEQLEQFERWFESSRGKPFYALFDQYVPEVPVVDF